MNDNQDTPLAPSKFPVGATVRVKLGTIGPDFPDIPIGGWAGTIQESEPPVYLVRWNQQTLNQMNSVYRKRCERDDLELEAMWLDESDLELDTSETAEIEQPTALVSFPLSQENQDDRIRVFDEEGLVSDFLPGMPFNFPSSFPKKKLSFTAALILVLVWGTVIGIVLGSLIASVEVARTLAVAGAVLLGILGFIAGSRLGMIFGRLNKVRSGSLWGGILGATVGGIVGALLGAMIVAAVGLLTGSILGALVSNLALGGRKKTVFIFLGSMVGATVQAFLLDQEQALVGAIYGGAIGVGAAITAMIGLKALAASYRARRQ